MEFGKVLHPEHINFELPPDHKETAILLKESNDKTDFQAFVGCAKWNRKELKGFYPKGIKDELSYYANQFNAIELNATFYKMPQFDQIATWKSKTPSGFEFFPKITNTISHYKRLVNVQPLIREYCDAVSAFENQLGMCFLQLHDNFKSTSFNHLQQTLEHFPTDIPLAVEVRNEEWFSNNEIADSFQKLLLTHNRANVIVDTAGRRDMLHMRLTSTEAFIRFVGSNHSSDIQRLDEWITRIQKWKQEGLKKLYFFVHQNVEIESPLLATHFIKNLNKTLGMNLPYPNNLEGLQQSMF